MEIIINLLLINFAIIIDLVLSFIIIVIITITEVKTTIQ